MSATLAALEPVIPLLRTEDRGLLSDWSIHSLVALAEGESDTEWDELGFHVAQPSPEKDSNPEVAVIPYRLRPGSPPRLVGGVGRRVVHWTSRDVGDR